MTRTARKQAINAKNLALKQQLIDSDMPNIAAKVGVDFFANDSHLIEMGDQNRIMQQQVGSQSNKY